VSSARANERVTVATSRTVVELPWESRQALLGQIRGLQSARTAIKAFEAVGTSRHVVLDNDAKVLIVDAIGVWAQNIGIDGLPEGVWNLRNALVDDLHDTAGGP
jgi:hypothetical protein